MQWAEVTRDELAPVVSFVDSISPNIKSVPYRTFCLFVIFLSPFFLPSIAFAPPMFETYILYMFIFFPFKSGTS